MHRLAALVGKGADKGGARHSAWGLVYTGLVYIFRKLSRKLELGENH